MQWKDSDFDGFGDNAIGAKRDDCPMIAGESYVDLQGCPDKNKDGYSNSYGEFQAAVTIMGASPTGSWLSFASVGVAMLLAITINRSGGLFGRGEKESGKILADIEGQETDATVPVIDMNTGEVQDLTQVLPAPESHYTGEVNQDPSTNYGAYSTETPYETGGDYGAQ